MDGFTEKSATTDRLACPFSLVFQGKPAEKLKNWVSKAYPLVI